MSKMIKTAICLVTLVLVMWVNGTGAYADYGFSSGTKSDFGFEQAKKSDYGYVEASNHTSATDIKMGYSPNMNYNYYYYNNDYCQNCRCFHQNGHHPNNVYNNNNGARAQQNPQYQFNNKTGNPQTLYQMFKN
jgi:hypothetical protein